MPSQAIAAGFGAIRSPEDFFDLYPEWEVRDVDRFVPGRWQSPQSTVKLNDWLDLVGGRWSSRISIIHRTTANERTLYPFVLHIIKDALLFQNRANFTVGDVLFGATPSEEDLVNAASTGVIGFKQNKPRQGSDESDIVIMQDLEEVVQLYCEIDKRMKGVGHGYARFVASEPSNIVGKVGRSRLVVLVKSTLFANAGYYQLCAELAHRFSTQDASDRDVYGLLTDTREFQFLKATRTAVGLEIHQSEVYCFRDASFQLYGDAYAVLGYLFDILDIDESIDIPASYQAVLAKEASLKDKMLRQARQSKGF